MMDIGDWVLAGAAFCGLIAGFFARRARFCTFGAVEDLLLVGDSTRLRTWVLAIAVAILGVQGLWWLGVLDLAHSFHLSAFINPVGLLVGGLLFGIGMAMVGNCAFGMLIRLGGGDLRALFVFLIMGLVAYATARGLPGLLRLAVFEPFEISMGALGGQGLGHVVAWVSGVPTVTASVISGVMIAVAMLVWCYRGSSFSIVSRDGLAGIAVGLAVTGGFWLSGGLAQQGFDPLSVRSLSYVLPPGETIVYVLTFTGSVLSFPVALVVGTLLGVWLAAMIDGDARIEGYDEGREMKRQFVGAILMGFGGVTALGCTVGQGISGMATLSLGAPIAMLGIILGAVAGIRVLMTGSVREGVSSLLSN